MKIVKYTKHISVNLQFLQYIKMKTFTTYFIIDNK